MPVKCCILIFVPHLISKISCFSWNQLQSLKIGWKFRPQVWHINQIAIGILNSFHTFSTQNQLISWSSAAGKVTFSPMLTIVWCQLRAESLISKYIRVRMHLLGLLKPLSGLIKHLQGLPKATSASMEATEANSVATQASSGTTQH